MRIGIRDRKDIVIEEQQAPSDQTKKTVNMTKSLSKGISEWKDQFEKPNLDSNPDMHAGLNRVILYLQEQLYARLKWSIFEPNDHKKSSESAKKSDY